MMPKINIKQFPEEDKTEIEGTMYSNFLFKELGCSFPDNIGQVLRVDKKEDGVVTVTRLNLLDAVKMLHDQEQNRAGFLQ